ncbi:hypothetical protein [Candidatus Allofournierella excrementigallinarum]|uniref:hypothetical protein n=1 Tax=Candidatus Allofournierella excrementigallinarum TaxID=2838592 RepID=UPI00374EE8ED
MKEKGQERRRRAFWQARLDDARRQYAEKRARMDRREDCYKGTRQIPAAGGGVAKAAGNVRNIIYELIESQVDASIPQPRVTAVHPEDRQLAKKAEAMLLAQIRQHNFKELNDEQERTVPIQGGAFWHVEWDPEGGFHCQMGDLSVELRHPKQVIPQPGVYDLEKMDYLFVLVSQSRRALEKRYGVQLPEEGESDAAARTSAEDGAVEGLVTQNIAYYRNGAGGVGCFSWVGDVTLEDMEDYQARRLWVCAGCGAPVEPPRGGKAARCPACGAKSARCEPVLRQALPHDVSLPGGEVLAAVSEGPARPVVNPDGTLQRDEATGEVILMPGEVRPTVVPAYRPRRYPLVLRRNVRLFGQLLGASDVDAVEDQQVAINKYGTKIQEKLLKGGSYVTLPQGVNIETTDRELKIIRLKNPADKALISVLNIQPDTSRDQQMLEVNYSWAKSTLGITDAFQGKYDSSATSGVAKQFSANQSAGRLQSKREMKNQAYARLYKLMFQFMLAYADEPYPMTLRGPDGTVEYAHFDRYEFLKRDAAGQLYWNDEFLFDVDPASNLASNRETLWSMIDQKYQAGAFGPLGKTASLYRLWSLLAETGYPHAEAMKASVGQQMEQEQGGQNALPGEGGSTP